MIIDVHTHLGWDHSFDLDFPKEKLVEKMHLYNVDIQIVQPGTCHDIFSVREQHNAIYELCKSYPGQFFGMANAPPHLPAGVYLDEIKRCVEELGFVGIKLHPLASGVNPGSRDGRKAFDGANKYNLALMIHTGSGAPFANPLNIIDVAKEYSDLSIIMAHCGMTLYADEARVAFASCPNIYGDTSWTPGHIMKKWIQTFGPRLMIASDHAENLGTELTKVRTFGYTLSEQEAILSTTALKVFKLENRINK
jgi:uncharacterized protein